MNKSHVSMEQALCMVCLSAYDTGALLLARRLGESLEPHTVTHVGGFCPACDKLKQDGYIAIVGATGPQTEDPAQVERTGDIVHVRSAAWAKIFSSPVPEHGIAFAEPDVIEYLRKLQ